MSYPDDIMKAARAVLTAPKHATRPHTELLQRIAGAIEDERRRCAEVCFEMGGNKHDRYSYEAQCGWAILGETPQWEEI